MREVGPLFISLIRSAVEAAKGREAGLFRYRVAKKTFGSWRPLGNRKSVTMSRLSPQARY